MNRPDSSEYADFYAGYVGKVPEGDILSLLRTEANRTTELLAGLSPEKASYRYADDKWSVKEVLGHVIDAERMFGNRAFCFAREDAAELPGFEQTDYAKSSNASRRSMADLLDEFRAVRQSNLALFRSLEDAAWSRRGIGSGCEFTVRALAYIILGHELHHRSVIQERYL